MPTVNVPASEYSITPSAPVALTPAPIVSAPGLTTDASRFLADADFATRNEALKAMALDAGIRLPKTRVPEGESLWDVGEAAARALATDVAKLPNLSDAVTALQARIVAEDARDAKVHIQRLAMEPTKAALVHPDRPDVALGYTRAGFSHLLALNGHANASATLLALPPAIRADAVNYFNRTAIRADSDQVVVRTIVDPNSGRRVIRAITSAKHSLTRGDDSAIIAAIQAAVPAGAKLRVTRSLDRTDLEIIWPALERQLRVGDIALVGIRIANSETKAGALHVSPALLRVLCYNFTTAWSDGADEEISMRHVGDLRSRLPAAFARALRVVEPFVRAFGDAYRNPLPDSMPTRGEVLQRAGKVFELASGVVGDAAKLWDADGAATAGDTLAGLVHALTRASQAQSMAASADTEKAAGQLIARGWGALA